MLRLETDWLFNEKIRVLLLGLGFLLLLLFSSFSNTLFFDSLGVLYQNQILVFLMIFMNNVIVISLITIGMTFYVKLVTFGFFKDENYSTVIIDNPRIFALIFSFVVLVFGVLRGVIHFFLKNRDWASSNSFTTPSGEDDAVAVMKYHAELQHKKDYPNGATTAEAKKYIKKV